MINEKLKKIKLVITDVDGVLTDGLLHYDANGEAIKSFHVRDGLGVKMLMDAGIQVAYYRAEIRRFCVSELVISELSCSF